MSGIAVTFVFVFSWIGVLVWLQMLSGDDSGFREQTQRVLERVRDGQLAEVYNDASPLFRKRISLNRFLDMAVDINQTLGGFRELLVSETVDTIDGPGGQTARVAVTIAFDAKPDGAFQYHRTDDSDDSGSDRRRTVVNGSFSYHRVGDSWRLLGFGFTLPPALAEMRAGRGPSRETAAVRAQAPSEVLIRAHEILELTRAGQIGTIYDQAAPVFRATIDRESFVALMAWRERKLGACNPPDKPSLATTRTQQNGLGNQATVVATIPFAKADAEVSLSFVNYDGQWRLSRYHVASPRPQVPAGTPNARSGARSGAR